MYYKIEPKKLEEILNKLAQKPWGLVNDIIVELSRLEKVTPDTSTSEPEQSRKQSTEAEK